ncbi:MAG: hypothetical protein JWO42_297 [Chloroflexi bacterium]|jgi:hypothetical protein|nr:hypothetical protein [Chloroflexota bacterium]
MEHDLENHVRKHNRRRVEESERKRPVVHGALPYLGHRPRPKDERRRISELVQRARKRK